MDYDYHPAAQQTTLEGCQYNHRLHLFLRIDILIVICNMLESLEENKK